MCMPRCVECSTKFNYFGFIRKKTVSLVKNNMMACDQCKLINNLTYGSIFLFFLHLA